MLPTYETGHCEISQCPVLCDTGFYVGKRICFIYDKTVQFHCSESNRSFLKVSVSPSMKTAKKPNTAYFLGDTWGCRGDFVEPSLGHLKSPLCALCVLSGANRKYGPARPEGKASSYLKSKIGIWGNFIVLSAPKRNSILNAVVLLSNTVSEQKTGWHKAAL